MNLITVKVGNKYSSDAVNRLVYTFHKHHANRVNVYCITDDARGLADGITVIEPSLQVPGWWNKIQLFHPCMPEGRNIYFDLDVVICGSLYRQMIGKQELPYFICSEDPLRWHGVRFGSAFMMWEGDYSHVYEHFKANSTKIINNTEGGDQAYLATQIEPIYLEDTEPYLVASYKRDVEPIKAVPQTAALVNFHGLPKPDDILNDEAHFLNGWLNQQYA